MPENDLDTYCAANQQRHVDELIEFLRIPSISADPAHEVLLIEAGGDDEGDTGQ